MKVVAVIVDYKNYDGTSHYRLIISPDFSKFSGNCNDFEKNAPHLYGVEISKNAVNNVQDGS